MKTAKTLKTKAWGRGRFQTWSPGLMKAARRLLFIRFTSAASIHWGSRSSYKQAENGLIHCVGVELHQACVWGSAADCPEPAPERGRHHRGRRWCHRGFYSSYISNHNSISPWWSEPNKPDCFTRRWAAPQNGGSVRRWEAREWVATVRTARLSQQRSYQSPSHAR